MKDRPFIIMLALAVAAGLVVGLIAFRTTGGSAAPGSVAATANTNAPGNAAQPSSAADEQVADQSSEPVEPLTAADAQDGGPSGAVKTPPPMQAPTVGDIPGAAASADGTLQ